MQANDSSKASPYRAQVCLYIDSETSIPIRQLWLCVYEDKDYEDKD